MGYGEQFNHKKPRDAWCYMLLRGQLLTVQRESPIQGVLALWLQQQRRGQRPGHKTIAVLSGSQFLGLVSPHQLLEYCLSVGDGQQPMTRAIATLITHPPQTFELNALTEPMSLLHQLLSQQWSWGAVRDTAQVWQGIVSRALLQEKVGQPALLQLAAPSAVLETPSLACTPETSLFQVAMALKTTSSAWFFPAIMTVVRDGEIQGYISVLEILEAQYQGLQLQEAIAADWIQPASLISMDTPLSQIATLVKTHPSQQAWLIDAARQWQGIIRHQTLLDYCDPVSQRLQLDQSAQNLPPIEQPIITQLTTQYVQPQDVQEKPQKAIAPTAPTKISAADVAILRRERDFLTTMFELAGALLLVLDHQGRIIRFNPACETLTGYRAAAVKGKYVWELFLKAQDIKPMMQAMERFLMEGTPCTHEVDWRSQDGTYRRVCWSCTVLHHAQDGVDYIIATGMDITERQTLERTLQTLNQELEQRVTERTLALTATETNLRHQLAAVDAAIEAIAILEADQFVSVNPAFLKLFGYPHFSHLQQKSWKSLFAPSEQARLATEILPQLLATDSWQGEAIAQRQDGSQFIQEISLTLTSDRFLICVSRDITSRKQTTANLRTTQALLRSQYDNFPIPTYTWQHRQGAFHLINFNTAADQVNQQQLAQLRQQTSAAIYGENHNIHQNIQTCFREQRSFEADLQTQSPDPSAQHHELCPRYLVISYIFVPPDMVMVHTQDLTERKRAEAKLQQNRAFLKKVIDNDPNLIFVRDRHGKFMLANQAMADLFGVNPDDLLGCTETEFHNHSAEADRSHHTDQQTMTAGKPLIFPEEKVTNYLGTSRYFRIVKIPLKANPNEPYSQILGVASDMTQQRQAKLKLETALAQERELNLLKSRFVNTASHEFRTPLTVIVGATYILQHYGQKLSPARRDKHLDNIETNAQRLEELIDNLLSISRIESGKLHCDRRPTQIMTCCEEIMANIKLSHGQNHHLEFLPEALPQELVPLDPDLLRHILSNLLTNACKYSPTGSRVTLKATGDPRGLHFCVEDRGIGIPEADQPHVFDSFYRAGNAGTVAGSGLGLNIVYESVKLHGGQIRVVSRLNVGSSFFIDIPFSA